MILGVTWGEKIIQEQILIDDIGLVLLKRN